jgi:ribosomal protein S18 acetylase RimI-like enzyme
MLLVEELAARAWPAAETLRVDGWLLRHTPSLTRRRSNSALPLGDGSGDLAVVEVFYASRAARARVQVSPAEARADLDAELARRGWSRNAPTDVLVADVDAVLERTKPGAVGLSEQSDPAWVAAWAACEERPDADEHARVVLAGIEPASAYARTADDLGVGLAVCERGWAGLFCVATAAGARRRGIAGHVVHALARWAAGLGANGLYLQVDADNAPAQALYARAGFRRAHGYHYRVAPEA